MRYCLLTRVATQDARAMRRAEAQGKVVALDGSEVKCKRRGVERHRVGVEVSCLNGNETRAQFRGSSRSFLIFLSSLVRLPVSASVSRWCELRLLELSAFS